VIAKYNKVEPLCMLVDVSFRQTGQSVVRISNRREWHSGDFRFVRWKINRKILQKKRMKRLRWEVKDGATALRRVY